LAASKVVKPRILLLDSDRVYRSAVAQELVQDGYDVVAGSIPTSAVVFDEMLKEVAPALILFDAAESKLPLDQFAHLAKRIVVYSNRPKDHLDRLVAEGGFIGAIHKGVGRFELAAAVKIALETAARAPLRSNEKEVTEELDDQEAPSSSRSSHPTCLPPSSVRKVVIIDDDPIALEIQTAALEEIGFEVRAVESFQQLATLIEHWGPDIVVTDVRMPGVPGDRLCYQIKRSSGALLVVLVSAVPREELRLLASDAGADGFVCKSEGAAAIAQQVLALATGLTMT
jgi:DNA-binding response OmpR family regulator